MKTVQQLIIALLLLSAFTACDKNEKPIETPTLTSLERVDNNAWRGSLNFSGKSVEVMVLFRKYDYTPNSGAHGDLSIRDIKNEKVYGYDYRQEGNLLYLDPDDYDKDGDIGYISHYTQWSIVDLYKEKLTLRSVKPSKTDGKHVEIKATNIK